MRGLLLIVAVPTGAFVANTSVDIHLKLDLATQNVVIGFNEQIRKSCPGEDIELGTKDQPHITLYLTAFQNEAIDELTATVGRVVGSFSRCKVVFPHDGLHVAGSYGMWNTANPPCLQEMSDCIVNATHKFAIPNQPVPLWVNGLPEPERSEKIKAIQEYGSPNVFSQFAPHVTIAFDSAPADNLTAAFESLEVKDATCKPITIGLGSVGPHGTVLASKDLADFAIPH